MNRRPRINGVQHQSPAFRDGRHIGSHRPRISLVGSQDAAANIVQIAYRPDIRTTDSCGAGDFHHQRSVVGPLQVVRGRLGQSELPVLAGVRDVIVSQADFTNSPLLPIQCGLPPFDEIPAGTPIFPFRRILLFKTRQLLNQAGQTIVSRRRVGGLPRLPNGAVGHCPFLLLVKYRLVWGVNRNYNKCIAVIVCFANQPQRIPQYANSVCILAVLLYINFVQFYTAEVILKDIRSCVAVIGKDAPRFAEVTNCGVSQYQAMLGEGFNLPSNALQQGDHLRGFVSAFIRVLSQHPLQHG